MYVWFVNCKKNSISDPRHPSPTAPIVPNTDPPPTPAAPIVPNTDPLSLKFTL